MILFLYLKLKTRQKMIILQVLHNFPILMKKYLTFLVCLLFTNLLSAQKNYLDVPFIETSAKVDTLVIPDRIFISVKINETDTKNKRTVEEQERTLEATLQSLGINVQEDLVLQDFGSNFKTYFFKGQNIVKSKQYSLLVRDAVKAGKVLTALENVGISNVDIERTEYSKEDEIKLLLKIKAIKILNIETIHQ